MALGIRNRRVLKLLDLCLLREMMIVFLTGFVFDGGHMMMAWHVNGAFGAFVGRFIILNAVKACFMTAIRCQQTVA